MPCYKGKYQNYLWLHLLHEEEATSFFKFVKGSAAQTPTASTSEQDAHRDTPNMPYMIIIVVLLVVAILLAIASIALGTMLCLTRKSVKAVSSPRHTPQRG